MAQAIVLREPGDPSVLRMENVTVGDAQRTDVTCASWPRVLRKLDM
jgi:hypothetical protein